MSYSELTQYFGFGDAPTAPPDPAPASNPMALSASDVVPPLLVALIAVVGIGYLLSSRPSMTPNRRRRGKKRGRSRGKRRSWKRGRKSSRRGRSSRKRSRRGKSRRSRGKRRGRRSGRKSWKRSRKWGRKKAKRWGKKRGRKSWKRGYRNVPWKYAGHRGAKHRALFGTSKYKNTRKGRKKWAKKAARRYYSKINYHGGAGAGWSKSSGGAGWGGYSGSQQGPSVSPKAGPPGWT